MLIKPQDYNWEQASDLQIIMMKRGGSAEAAAEWERRQQLKRGQITT